MGNPVIAVASVVSNKPYLQVLCPASTERLVVTSSTASTEKIYCGVVRLLSNVNVQISIHEHPSVASYDMPLIANTSEYFHVVDGKKVGVVKMVGQSDGDLFCTKMLVGKD